MKNLKLGIFSLLAIFAVSIFLTSCEQDAIDIPNTVVESNVNELSSLDHDKDLEILSENGLNKVTITVSGNDVSLLEEIKRGDFKIIPIFEQPAESLDQPTDDRGASISDNKESFDGKVPVGFNVSNVELEEGAIGYSIEVKRTDYSKSGRVDTWYSSRNKAKVKTTYGCTKSSFYRKYYCKSSNSHKLTASRCAGGSISYNSGNSCLLKVKVQGTTSSYWYQINFYN